MKTPSRPKTTMNAGRILATISMCSAVLCVLQPAISAATSQNFGVAINDGATPGYTLFAPFRGTSAYLIDNEGHVVKEWKVPEGYSSGGASQISPRGTLVRSLETQSPFPPGNGLGGLIREVDWDNNILWDYPMNTLQGTNHHALTLTGDDQRNVMVTAYEQISKEECQAAGLPADYICPDSGLRLETLVEIAPDYVQKTGKIVWKWRLFDHLLKDQQVASEHSELWDIRKGEPNFNHIDYRHDWQQILISCNYCNEVFVIERSTTKQAARHKGGRYEKGGDFLYRWGNPANYDRGTAADQKLNFQHGARWRKWADEYGHQIGPEAAARGELAQAGIDNILVFNNRIIAGPPARSWVTEIKPPQPQPLPNGHFPTDYAGEYRYLQAGVAYGPDTQTDISGCLTPIPECSGFYSYILSNPQPLPNGHLLIASTAGVAFGTPEIINDPLNVARVIELDRDGYVVWKFVNPIVAVNPGNKAGGGKLPNACLEANATQMPKGATNWMFRATRYADNFVGFEGKDLTPGPLATDYCPRPAAK